MLQDHSEYVRVGGYQNVYWKENFLNEKPFFRENFVQIHELRTNYNLLFLSKPMKYA